ncbi:helix-turn-helix transcriptional regulator [Thauera sedimentorum]|nr:autoinducer binding domain-containing protein [Thauera sedimentorum]
MHFRLAGMCQRHSYTLPFMQRPDLGSIIEKLQTAQSGNEVLERLIEGFADLGVAGVVHCAAGSQTPLIQGSSLMCTWAQHYEGAGYLPHDPVVLELLRTGTFKLWHADHPAETFSTLQRRIFGEVAEHGLRSGMSVPIYLGSQMHVLGLFAAEELPHDHEVLARLNYVALLAHERVNALSQTGRKDALFSALSPRERDCLNWTKEGLTAAEIACKLNLSERTVIHHLQGAKARLGARNLPHAVARAIAEGELLL